MTSGARNALVVLLVAIAASCSEPTRYVPPAGVIVRPGSPVTVLPPLPFPSLAKPGTIYVEASPPNSAAPRYLTRYVLYDDGTHALQMGSTEGGLEFTGSWTRADSTIAFKWDAWSAAGPWGATGTVRGEQLVVQYNAVMQMTDFEDEIYVRMRQGEP
jgi:hypothetical protein